MKKKPKKKITPRDGSELLLYYLEPLKKSVTGVVCLCCGWVGISYSVHDFKTCRRSNSTMVDGGRDYLRYGAMDMKKVQVVDIAPAEIKEK